MDFSLIWEIVIVLLVVIAAVTLACIVDFTRSKKNKMSFRESMDLTELPVVTFRQDGKDKFNFLLDTGSSLSVINESILNIIKHTDLECTSSVYGMEGNSVETSLVSIPLKYKDTDYVENFQVVDMSAAFDKVKKENGVTIHGILGNSFFVKYKYVLDFKELIAYSR